MGKIDNVQSVLSLKKLIFDKIEFKRQGISSDKELKVEIQSSIAQRQEDEMYRVTLTLKGVKPEEYTFEISLVGYFAFGQDEELTEEQKNTLISKNTIAIMMPYLRSEVSLLTAQPGMDCVVIPVFNTSKIFED